MSRLTDPIREGLARGWRVAGGRHGAVPEQLTCDVAIVGSGAGAGITAEILTKAGLKVLLIEEGPLKTSTDFRQLESEAYPSLYQESAARKTARQGDYHPAGALRRRLHDGQLDKFLPHAGSNTGLLAAPLWPAQSWQ